MHRSLIQVFLLERPETSTPELQREMEEEKPNPRLFRDYTLRLYSILQKVTLEQMRNVLFALQGHGTDHADTVEGLLQLNRELFLKFNAF